MEDEDEPKERRGGVAGIRSSTAEEDSLPREDLRSVSSWKRINGALTPANAALTADWGWNDSNVSRSYLLPWQPGATECARVSCSGYVLNTKI